MKKVMLILMVSILLIGIVSAAQNGSGTSQGQNNQNNQGGTSQQNQGLGQQIRNKVQAGTYTSETGEQMRVSEMAQNRVKIKVGEVEAECGCNMTQEKAQNKTKLKVKLNNGRNAEVKVMPNTASENALTRLRLKQCNQENECKIELKEVGKSEDSKLAYELQAQRHFRILGMFKTKAQVKAQVDAETGELIQVKKPWWAFLASEPEE